MFRLREFEVRLASPLHTAKGDIAHREGLLTLLVPEDDSRSAGIGEATPLPGWTEPYEECAAGLRSVADASPRAAASELEDRPAARHGVTLAELDAAAREAGVSLASLLASDGDDPLDRVPINATIGADDVERSVDAALEAVERGFRTLKLKVGVSDVQRDVERVAAVREAVGDDVSIRLDANGGWTQSAAEQAIDGLAPFDVEYLEQPVAADDLDGLASLRGHGIDIAADEAFTKHDPDRVLEVADAVVLKPMVLGGIDRARELAAAATSNGTAVTVTTTIDAVIARTAAVHLAAAIPDVSACGLATGELLASDLAPDPCPVEDGEIRVPRGPGLGGDLLEQVGSRYDLPERSGGV